MHRFMVFGCFIKANFFALFCFSALVLAPRILFFFGGLETLNFVSYVFSAILIKILAGGICV